MDTIEGQLALNIADARKALGNIGRSTVYRLIAAGELEVVRFDGRPKITARSILKLLGLSQNGMPTASSAFSTTRESSSGPAYILRGIAAHRHSPRRCINTDAK